MQDTETPVARALRAIQILDERMPGVAFRYLLIQAEDALGDELGLDCTGVPSGWNEDGSVACYDHDSDTCPIHEWLVPGDASE